MSKIFCLGLVTCLLVLAEAIPATADSANLAITVVHCSIDHAENLRVAILPLSGPHQETQVLRPALDQPIEDATKITVSLPPGPYMLSAKTEHCFVEVPVVMAGELRHVWVTMPPGLRFGSFQPEYLVLKLPEGATSSSTVSLTSLSDVASRTYYPKIAGRVAYFDSIGAGKFLLSIALGSSRACRLVTVPDATAPVSDRGGLLSWEGLTVTLSASQLASALRTGASGANAAMPCKVSTF